MLTTRASHQSIKLDLFFPYHCSKSVPKHLMFPLWSAPKLFWHMLSAPSLLLWQLSAHQKRFFSLHSAICFLLLCPGKSVAFHSLWIPFHIPLPPLSYLSMAQSLSHTISVACTIHISGPFLLSSWLLALDVGSSAPLVLVVQHLFLFFFMVLWRTLISWWSVLLCFLDAKTTALVYRLYIYLIGCTLSLETTLLCD